MSSKLKACFFCGADKKHFRVQPKKERRDVGIKTYELDTPAGSIIIERDLDVMQCVKCKRKWMRWKEIERSVSEDKHSR